MSHRVVGIASALALAAVEPALGQSASITVGRNLQVSQAHPRDTHYEVLAAIDPRNPDRMIVGSFLYPERNTAPSSIVYATRDGGKSWTPTLHGPTLLHTSDPAPAFGPDGTAYYTASLLGPPPSPRDQRKMLLFRSMDGGYRWEAPDTFTYSDRQYITVDHTGGKYHGRIYVNGNNRMPYGISDFIVFSSGDRGRSWQGPGKRAGFGKFGASSMGNSVIASDGRLIGVFADENLLQAIVSKDGGATLEPAITIDAEHTPGGDRKGARNNVVSLPVIAIDASAGERRDWLYTVWADRRSGHTRIYLASSADRGATWTPARRIDDGSANDSVDHFMPTVAVNRNGEVGVMWYDRRNHPDNLGWDVRFTASTDGGKSFLPSVQVSEQGTSFGKSTQWTGLRANVTRTTGKESALVVDVSLNTFTFLGGDTNGLVAGADGVFHAVWVDNRTGVPQIWTAPISVAPQPPARGVDLSDKVTLDIGEHWYDRTTETLHASVRLRNTSTAAITGPFRVQVLNLASELGDLSVSGADNGVTGAGAEWRFDDAHLAPNAHSRPLELRFVLSNPRSFRSGDRYRLGLLQLKVRVLGPAAKAD